MKILMLTSRFGSGYGMGYSAHKEAQTMADAGHAVTVVHSNADIAGYDDVRIEFVHLPVRRSPFIDFIIFRRDLKKLFDGRIQANGYDVVYVQSLEFGVMDFSRIRKPVWYFARSTMLGIGAALKREGVRLSPVKVLIRSCLIAFERRCLRFSSGIFAKSNMMARELQDLYSVDDRKIYVVSGGIDPSDFDAGAGLQREDFRKNHQLPSTKPVVLFAGRLIPQKGLTHLVKAALGLLGDYAFTVVIAGTGEAAYAAKVQRLIESAKRQRDFVFLGHIDQKEMPSLLAAADCVVTPSLYEPFGMINLQAACMGKAVITTSITGSAEALAGYAPLKVVEPGSVEALQRALKEWLTNHEMPTLALDLADLSWKHVAQEMMRNFNASRETETVRI
ncbi:glycosyltransferase family 4 protein [Candidatus Uhrbacteria bacterium]|nr:glycosyltransferase family 4 protein [Candidatus Uhrbacteria bacterium]